MHLIGVTQAQTKVPGSEKLVVKTDFPYQFWEPSRRQPYYSPLNDQPPKYHHFHGTLAKEDNRNNNWAIMPIQIPDNLLRDVNERTTINPNTYAIEYPTSPTPQYGRHPGSTEPPPLIFPPGSSHNSNLKYDFWKDSGSQASIQKVYAVHQPNSTAGSILRDEPFSYFDRLNNRPLMVYKVNKQPGNDINKRINHYSGGHNPTTSLEPRIQDHRYSINTNHRIKLNQNYGSIPIHQFFPIKDPITNNVRFLHVTDEDGSRIRYKPQGPNNLNINRPIKTTFQPSHQYTNQEFQDQEKYNEFLINTKDKSGNKFSYEDIFSDTFEQIGTHSGLNFKIVQQSLPINNNDQNQTYNAILSHNQTVELNNRPLYIPSQPQTNIQPIYKRPFPYRNHKYQSYQNQPAYYDNVSGITKRPITRQTSIPNQYIKNRIQKYKPTNNPTRRVPSYQPNYEYQNDFSYLGTDLDIDRLSGLEAIPTSLLVPGGFVILAIGLALYYFNFVWYPTPVVTARLIQILNELRGDKLNSTLQEQALYDVSTVFRSLETKYPESEVWDDVCKNRIVCQANKEFPPLWSATQASSILFRSHLNLIIPNGKDLTDYLEAAQTGYHQYNCQDKYPNCPLPHFQLKDLLLELISKIEIK